MNERPSERLPLKRGGSARRGRICGAAAEAYAGAGGVETGGGAGWLGWGLRSKPRISANAVSVLAKRCSMVGGGSAASGMRSGTSSILPWSDIEWNDGVRAEREGAGSGSVRVSLKAPSEL